MWHHRVLAVMAGGWLVLGPWATHPAVAINWTFGNHDNIKPTAEDMRMIEASISMALEQRKEGAVSTWANSATKRAGKSTVIRVYMRGTQPCGMVEHVFTAGGDRRYEFPYCRNPDGSWKIQY